MINPLDLEKQGEEKQKWKTKKRQFNERADEISELSSPKAT